MGLFHTYKQVGSYSLKGSIFPKLERAVAQFFELDDDQRVISPFKGVLSDDPNAGVMLFDLGHIDYEAKGMMRVMVGKIHSAYEDKGLEVNKSDNDCAMGVKNPNGVKYVVHMEEKGGYHFVRIVPERFLQNRRIMIVSDEMRTSLIHTLLFPDFFIFGGHNLFKEPDYTWPPNSASNVLEEKNGYFSAGIVEESKQHAGMELEEHKVSPIIGLGSGELFRGANEMVQKRGNPKDINQSLRKVLAEYGLKS